MKKLLSFFIIMLFILGFSNVLINANEYLPKSDNYIQDEIAEYYSDELDYVVIKDFIRVESGFVYTLIPYSFDIEFGDITFYEYDKTKTLIGEMRASYYSPAKICLFSSATTKYIMGKFEYIGEAKESVEETFCIYKGEGTHNGFSGLKTENLGFQNSYTYIGSNVVGEYYTSVDNPTSPETIKSAIKAMDDYDGNLTANIVTPIDTYSENMNKVGAYQIKYEVSDSSKNKAEFLLNVYVKDLTAPVIKGKRLYTFEPTDNVTIDDIQSQLTVTDNYYTNLSTDDIVMKNDGLTGNENKLGEYNLSFEVTDDSGNIGKLDAVVEIKDTIAPTITGESEKTIGTSESLDEDAILSLFSANDSFEGDVSESLKILSSEYDGNEDTIGNYEIEIEAQDSSGNKAIHVLKLSVVDTTPPNFYVTDMIVNVQTNQNLDNQTLIATVAKRYNVEKYETAEVIYNEYFNDSKEGSYRVLVKLDEEEYELFINAYDNLYDEVAKEKTTFLGRLWDLIITLFKKIKNFINGN